MIVGFTGTRDEITCEQHHALSCWVADNEQAIAEFHHGCCVGADAAGAEIVQALASKAAIVAHPPDNRKLISETWEEMSTLVFPPLPYLERNRKIVELCDILLACPKSIGEELRSGTWSTVRHAMRSKKGIVIFRPDGSIEER